MGDSYNTRLTVNLRKGCEVEIAYLIEPDIQALPLLIVRLMELKRPQNQVVLPQKNLTPSFLKQITSGQDREAIDFLMQAELQFQRERTGRTPHAESTSFSTIHLAPTQILPALQLLASTQKLYFNQKQLIVDFYGAVEFYYQLTNLEKQQIAVAGRLKWRDHDIDVKECDWIGAAKPHPWFIKGLALKFIHTHINWKDLSRLRQGHPWILEGVQKTAFLEDLDPDDPDDPKVVMAGGSLYDLQQGAEPTPILILRDRVGACADLWMNYGAQQIAFHDPAKEIKAGAQSLKRQQEVEKAWEKDLLETSFIRKDVGQSHYYCPVDKVARSLTFLLEIGWPIQDWKGNWVKRQGEMDVQVDLVNQHFLVKGRLRYEDHEVNLAKVIGAFNRRERFVELSPGTVGLLPDRLNNGLQELAEESELVGDQIKIKKSHIGSLQDFLPQAHVDSSLAHLKEKLKDFSHITESLPGPSFSGQLRPYQQQGVNWLSFLREYGFHGLLADDMGLGKTVQVLALLSRLSSPHPHLIVVPTSLLFNWQRECERFIPHFAVYVHQGPQRIQDPSQLEKYAIIITSYTMLRLDLALFESLSYDCLILDEAQVIKNAYTQTAQSVCRLKAQFRLSITGTPVENHLGELWSHFHFLIPDLLGDQESFNNDLQAAQSDSRYLQRIKRKISPFILRRKKEEVAKDLPERIDQIVWIDMYEEQRRFYEQFLASSRQQLIRKVELDGFQKHRMEVFEVILRLRQICCAPQLISQASDEDRMIKSAKLDSLEQDLETALEEGRKVLIYSQFTSMLKLMSKHAKEKGWPYVYLDGQTSQREKVIQQFQEDPNIPFFFISLKAGGVGLNLTAADYVFLYDPWWNEAVEEQAINRAHRIGRQDTVIAKRFLVRESIEEKILKLKTSKRLVIEEVVEDQPTPLHLNWEEIYDLLS